MAKIRLTPRQREVLELVLRGMSSPAIARLLHRSVRTIESHRLELGKKLGARNSADLIRKAIEHGLVDADIAVQQDRNPTAPPDQLIATLRSLDAAVTSATSGEGMLKNLCAQMGATFGVVGVIIGRRTSRGRLRPVASWTDPFRPLDIDWDFALCPCSKLGSAEIATVPYSELSDEMKRDLAPVLQEQGWLTIVPLHESRENQLGMIGLLHHEPLDATRCPHALLRFSAMCIVAELLHAKYRDELDEFRLHLDMVERYSGAASFRMDTNARLLWLSDHLHQGFLAHADAKPECFHTMLTTLGGRHDAEARRNLEARLARREPFALQLPVLASGPSPAVIAIQCRPIDPITGRAHKYIGIAQRLPAGIEYGPPDAEAPGVQSLGACATSRAVAAWGPLDSHASIDTTEPGRVRSADHARLDFSGLHPARPMPAGDSSRASSPGIPCRKASEPCRPPQEDAPGSIRRATPPQERPARHADNPAVPLEPEAFHWMFMNNPNAMCVATLDGWIRRANPALCNALEATEEELCAEPFYTIFEEADHARVRELVNRIGSGQHIEQVILPIRTRRGGRILIAWSCPPAFPGTDLFTPTGRVLWNTDL